MGPESSLFVAGGERPPVVETALGRIGIGICYDLWFPELARDLAVRGADLLAVPSNLSASPAQTGLPHLDVVVAIATAHVNRVHLVLADRCRTERGNEWLGAALVVDADGTLLAGPPPAATRHWRWRRSISSALAARTGASTTTCSAIVAATSTPCDPAWVATLRTTRALW